MISVQNAMARSRTWVIAATTQCDNHYTTTAYLEGQQSQPKKKKRMMHSLWLMYKNTTCGQQS